MIYIEKSQPAPECLEIEKKKASGDYKCGNVLERLKNDFKNKCYLCEYNGPETINVEHFIPHKDDKNLKFDWNNLFWSCGHCNNTKHHKFENILNCTIKKHEIETAIKYQINPFPKEKVTLTPLKDLEIVHNTIELLDAVYNGTTKLKIIESANLRKKLLEEIRKFQDLLFDYYDDRTTDEDKEKCKSLIKRMLNSSSSFTSFKRWIIRNNKTFKKEFEMFFE